MKETTPKQLFKDCHNISYTYNHLHNFCRGDPQTSFSKRKIHQEPHITKKEQSTEQQDMIAVYVALHIHQLHTNIKLKTLGPQRLRDVQVSHRQETTTQMKSFKQRQKFKWTASVPWRSGAQSNRKGRQLPNSRESKGWRSNLTKKHRH